MSNHVVLIGELNTFTGEWEKVYGIAESEQAAQEWVKENVPDWEELRKLRLVSFILIHEKS